MTHTLRRLVLVPLVLLGLVAAGRPLVAQVAFIDNLRFTTEFPFAVNTVAFPAGTYTVTRVTGSPRLLQLSNVATKTKTLVTVSEATAPLKPPYPSGVTFERRADKYLLSSFWDSSTHIALNPPVPTAEIPKGSVTVQEPIYQMVPATTSK
jgi:hypothetical protein